MRGGRRGKGWGFHKKHRGKGSKGGKGMGGTGKKGGAKITFRTRYFPDYFGKHGFVNPNKTSRNANNALKIININEINERAKNLIKTGKSKKSSEGLNLDLSGYKILGTGECKEKLLITCNSCSNSAKEKVEKAGGKIIYPAKREVKEKKTEIKKG